MKTKPFNLEEALANPDRVICRDGIKPSDLHYFKQVEEWRFTRPGSNCVYYANLHGSASICGSDQDLLLTCETKLVPFTYETCPVGAEVVHRFEKWRAQIHFAGANTVQVGAGKVTYAELLEDWLIAGTKAPCGVEVEE